MTDETNGRLTMQDIARKAGVSPITVSRALSGSATVKAETRDKVIRVASELGYRFNVAARNLRQQRTSTVAVVIEMAADRARPMNDPYPLALLGGIIEELSVVGYSAMLSTADNFIGMPVSADGVILLGQGSHDDAVRLIGRCGLPLVVWGSTRNDGGRHVVVGSDNLAGGKLAGVRLGKLGRRRALFLGDIEHAEPADRFEGFVDGMKDFGGTVLSPIACPFTFEGGHRAIHDAMTDGNTRFDAVFAASDEIAMGAVRALIEQGKRVPDQVSVIGFDDSASAQLFVPSLTTVHQDWDEGGRLLARKALSMIQGETARSEMMPVSLVVRAT